MKYKREGDGGSRYYGLEREKNVFWGKESTFTG